MIYLSTSNQAQCRATWLMETNALTTTQCRHAVCVWNLQYGIEDKGATVSKLYN